jgi:zinc D-Ala-D-Ala carboxypeptidase
MRRPWTVAVAAQARQRVSRGERVRTCAAPAGDAALAQDAPPHPAKPAGTLAPMPAARALYNACRVDAVPAATQRARASGVARRLAGAQFLLRRKADGRFLGLIRGAAGGYRLHPLDPALADRRLDVDVLLRMLGVAPRSPLHPRRAVALRHLPRHQLALPAGPSPLGELLGDWQRLGIDALAYAERSGLALQLEPTRLHLAGRDRYGRALWLQAAAAAAWQAMRAAAAAEGVALQAISGFRGHAYQRGIVERKLARGLRLEAILQVNAAPGFSEHHSGRALDIGTPGEPAAEESFEHSAAFAWLARRGGDFGFRLSYPRDNPHGIVYEPWHWCFAA